MFWLIWSLTTLCIILIFLLAHEKCRYEQLLGHHKALKIQHDRLLEKAMEDAAKLPIEDIGDADSPKVREMRENITLAEALQLAHLEGG